MSIRTLASKTLGRIGESFPNTLGHRAELLRQLYVEQKEAELVGIDQVLDRLNVQRDLAVDVGANYGAWTFTLARSFSRVLAVEPNVTLARNLRRLVPRHCSVAECGVSAVAGYGALYVPKVSGRPLTGWASFDPKNCPEADGVTTIPVVIETLDRLLADLWPNFIKIDVEGHEYESLLGSRRVLEQVRPVFMIEVKDKSRCDVVALMREFRYEAKELRELSERDGHPDNMFFCPI